MFVDQYLTDVYNEKLVEDDNYFMIPAWGGVNVTDFIPAGKDDINKYLNSYFADTGHNKTFNEAMYELIAEFPNVELITYTHGQIQQLDFEYLED